MKKIIQCFLCLGLFFCIAGCSKQENKKKQDTPTNESDTPSIHKVKKYTVQGKIEDATNNSFIITGEDGKSYQFVRTKMKLIGEALLVNEVIKVTYSIKDGKNIALQGEVISIDPIKKQGVEDIVANMTLEEKVGQLFFVRCPNTQAIEDVFTYKLGGYILFDRDFNSLSFQQVVNNVASYQAQASIPLFIGVDEEGGSVVRLSRYPGFRAVPFWAPQDLYNAGGFDLIRSDTKEKAELLKAIGININLAPVADVSTNPADFINARSFGKDANMTSQFVETVVDEMNKNGMGATLKHFPGYGNNIDTHTGISIDQRPFDSFEKIDFKPFLAGIKAGVGSILVSHNIINSMDAQHPASLSKNVHDILRHELGFQGVIMTDDLAMGAILQYSDDQSAAVSAIKAGNDLLICTNYREQIPAVIQEIQNGGITQEQIDASLKRILQWKVDLGLIIL